MFRIFEVTKVAIIIPKMGITIGTHQSKTKKPQIKKIRYAIPESNSKTKFNVLADPLLRIKST
jgi:hypothetical protein